MRLKLQVKRHELPTRSLLWTVADETITVSKLLENVNEIIPLESDQGGWGLEDYVVELGGFECLHFGVLKHTFKDEDSLSIRPLEQRELRQRRSSGSHQIAASGAHLIDGVAFGKSYIKRPDRPSIAIPPRKRRKVDHSPLEDALAEEEPGLLSVAQNRDGKHVQNGPNLDSKSGYEAAMSMGHEKSQTKKYKKVSFREPPARFSISPKKLLRDPSAQTLTSHESTDDDSDEDFNPDDGLSESSSQGSSSDRSSSSGNEGSKWLGNDGNLAQQLIPETSETSGSLDSSDDSSSVVSDLSSSVSDNSSTSGDESIRTASSNDSSSDSSSDDPRNTSSTKRPIRSQKSIELDLVGSRDRRNPTEPIAATAEKESHPGETASDVELELSPQQNVVPPGHGLKKTQSRNQRRKLSRQLKQLKASGLAPEDADYNFVAENPSGINIAPPDEQSSTPPTLPEPEISVERPPIVASPTPDGNKTESGTPEGSQTRRPRLDLGSSRRLIFGGLGMRTPKTKADEESLRTKFDSSFARPTPVDARDAIEYPTLSNTDAATGDSIYDETVNQPVAQSLAESDTWRDHIMLMAVECHDQGVELSTPPFPFEQRWDPQQHHAYRSSNFAEDGSILTAKQKRRRLQRKRKRAFAVEDEYEDFDGDSEYQQGHLNYDEEPEAQVPYLNLPELPSDMSNLEILESNDMAAGLIIAFKQLEMSQRTQWQPVVSDYKTAILVDAADPTSIVVKLADRDLEHKTIQYDDDGNRVFAKFEMPTEDDEDDTEDDGIRQISFEQMIEPKVVQRPSVEGGGFPNRTIEQDIRS